MQLSTGVTSTINCCCFAKEDSRQVHSPHLSSCRCIPTAKPLCLREPHYTHLQSSGLTGNWWCSEYLKMYLVLMWEILRWLMFSLISQPSTALWAFTQAFWSFVCDGAKLLPSQIRIGLTVNLGRETESLSVLFRCMLVLNRFNALAIMYSIKIVEMSTNSAVGGQSEVIDLDDICIFVLPAYI